MTWHAPSLAAEEVRLVIYIKDKSIAERELLIWTQQQHNNNFYHFSYYSYSLHEFNLRLGFNFDLVK
jgi:hypothetical protein